jgi:hypothetical protein
MSRTRERKRIAKDPFHQQILDALGRHLDPEVFEDCMADLLRDVFPGLVPVPGGNDAGMDGAIADGKGEPYPLVCTTGEDVVGNLRDNLDSFLGRGLSSRKVAVATSQTLTPTEIRKLFGLANEKRFTLLQVFERSALATLLYRDTIWCKRLLQLTGAPSALSVVPLSRRPQVDIELKGREEDAEWLRNTTGDRVVLGLPGSGKTYLFSSLIRSGWPALFLVSDDGTAIANAVRDQNPGVVVVDDAHVEPERLTRLRRLRDEIQGDFEIVASSWPGASTDVIEVMGGLPESRVHNLGLLPRAQILEIFQDLDVRPRDEILRDLVSQAGNKPGLAVTIAQLWRQGEWQKIIDGTVLSRTLLVLFKGLTGGEVADVLAAFSLGGRRGMSLEAVAGFLEIPSRDVFKIATDLSAGGVLSPVDTERLAVNPQVLRSALLRQIFFPGSPIRRDYRKLLPLTPSFSESVVEIMAARAYDAVIPPDELHDLVLRSGSRQAWSTLVMVDEMEARWVLENYPDDLLNVATYLLLQIPRAVIPKIFERAAEIVKSGSSRPQKSIEILSDWVQDYWAGPEEWIHRRWMVAKAAKKFLLEGGDRGIGIHGICIALSPKRRGDSLDPGKGDTVYLWSGLLPAETLRQVEPIWVEVRDAIQEIDAVSWQHLLGVLWDWIHPDSVAKRQEVATDQRDFMHGFAALILRDLATRAQSSPGLKAALKLLAIKAGVTLSLEQDATFLLLYPKRDSNLEVQREKEGVQREQIKALAGEWSQGPPSLVAERVVFYEREAQKVGLQWSQNVPALCRVLADMVKDPELWLAEFVSQDLRGHLISPFLERIVRDRRDGWDRQLDRCLSIRSLQWSAATLILTLPSPPLPLLEKVLSESIELATLIEGLCLGREIPLLTLSRLLRHPQWETALSAAVGEWCADPQSEVREEILPEWRSAILRSKTEEYSDSEHAKGLQYWLGVILSGDPDLSLEWLRNRLRDHDLPWHFLGDSPFANALCSLRKDHRMALLQDLEAAQEPEPAPIIGDIIPLLIQKDVEFYGKLLSLKRLSEFHLAPLEGLPQSAWSNLALVALQAGYEPAQIAAAAFEPASFWGSGVEYWESWDLAFGEIEREGTEELQEIARHGRQIARVKLRRAKARQGEIELHGFHGG